jgi:hypothetical protein
VSGVCGAAPGPPGDLHLALLGADMSPPPHGDHATVLADALKSIAARSVFSEVHQGADALALAAELAGGWFGKFHCGDPLRSDRGSVEAIHRPCKVRGPPTGAARRGQGRDACRDGRPYTTERMSRPGAPSLQHFPSTSAVDPPAPGSWCSCSPAAEAAVTEAEATLIRRMHRWYWPPRGPVARRGPGYHRPGPFSDPSRR